VPGVTSKLLVSVVVDQKPTSTAAVTRYLAANVPVRPPVADALAYGADFFWSLDAGAGKAGERTVYVWFGDADGNWSAVPLSASITFDNPPTTRTLYYDRSGINWCTSLKNTATVKLVGDAATDPDGNTTLTLTRLWTKAADFAQGTDLTNLITADGTSITVQLTLTTSAYATVQDWYTVTDEYGLTANGTFYIEVGYSGTCP
jgi:hypothetical protein